MKRIKVLILEDHPVFCDALKEMLSYHAEIDVVAAIDSEDNVFQKVVDLMPNVVVIDVSLSGSGGLAASRAIKKLCPLTQVVILSDDDSKAYRKAIWDSGASMAVRKADIAVNLVSCIRQMAGKGVAGDDDIGGALTEADPGDILR